MHTRSLPFWVLDQWVQSFSESQGAGGCRSFSVPCSGRRDVDGGLSSPLPGKYRADGFFTPCALWAAFIVSERRFSLCSFLMSATSYYMQILSVNCFTDIRCFFFALFVTLKSSFVQFHVSISLTDC